MTAKELIKLSGSIEDRKRALKKSSPRAIGADRWAERRNPSRKIERALARYGTKNLPIGADKWIKPSY